jgi:hypothetical protein
VLGYRVSTEALPSAMTITRIIYQMDMMSPHNV